MSPSATDVIVVGAGVIGMCTALELAKRGLSVTILERGEPGRESSWAGAGILAPLRPWHYPEKVQQLCRESLALYPGLVRELYDRTGIDVQLLFCGGRLHDPADMAIARQWHDEQGLPCFEEAEGARPWLRMPWLAQIRNPRLMKALVAAIPAYGIRLRHRCAVQGLLQRGSRVEGVIVQCAASATQERLLAGHVVIAAGAWSGRLCESAPPVSPVRGQMLLLRPRRRMPAGVWLVSGGYAVLRADGLCLLGATVEAAGFDKSVTSAARNKLLAVAAMLGEELRGASILQQWSGLRPGIADGVPRIGADGDRCGLWWNTGHFRNGLAMAPASARGLAERVAQA